MYSKDLFYLIGVIYGDGYIRHGPKSKKDPSPHYGITIDISDIEYLREEILPLFQKFTNTKAQVKIRTFENRKTRGCLVVSCKKFYKLLTEEIQTHKGPKTRDIDISPVIKAALMELKKEFIAGYFDTDGGFRGKVIGITTNNKNFQEFFYETVTETGIRCSYEKWFNKKYQKDYYGVRIKIGDIDKFLKTFRLRNFEKLAKIKAKFS